MQTTSFRPSVRTSARYLVSATKFVVGILYRKLSSEGEFGDDERWGGRLVVKTVKYTYTYTVKPCHILEVKNA